MMGGSAGMSSVNERLWPLLQAHQLLVELGREQAPRPKTVGAVFPS